MAVLRGNFPIDVAGPEVEVDIAECISAVEFGINVASTGDVAGSGIFDVGISAAAFGIQLYNAMVEMGNSKNAITVIAPKSYPEVWIPYAAQQTPGGRFGDDACPCVWHRRRYFVIYFNTHTAEFKVQNYSNKNQMMDAFKRANENVTNAHLDFEKTDKDLKSPLPYNLARYCRTMQGIFRWQKRLSVKKMVVGYTDQREFGLFCGLVKSCRNTRAKSIDRFTGSWDALLKVCKLSWKPGLTVQAIGCTVSNFIGMWASATGDISTIVEASNSKISPNSNFSSSIAYCTCYFTNSSKTHTEVWYRWDTVSAWK